MKLICDKCKKEIEEYRFERKKFEGLLPSWQSILHVSCHGEKQHSYLNPLLQDLNASNYGDIHFFKKDEPIKTAKFRRYTPSSHLEPPTKEELEWCRRVREWSNGIKALADHLDYKACNKKKDEAEKNCFINCENVKRKIKSIAYCDNKIIELEDEIGHLKRVESGLRERIERYKALCLKKTELLTWTKDKPAEEGNYLLGWHDKGNLVNGFARVYGSDDILMANLFCSEYRSNLSLDCITGEWAGPIPEPV